MKATFIRTIRAFVLSNRSLKSGRFMTAERVRSCGRSLRGSGRRDALALPPFDLDSQTAVGGAAQGERRVLCLLRCQASLEKRASLEKLVDWAARLARRVPDPRPDAALGHTSPVRRLRSLFRPDFKGSDGPASGSSGRALPPRPHAGCPRANGTNDKAGGNVPSGNTASRSPARSLSDASRNAASTAWYAS